VVTTPLLVRHLDIGVVGQILAKIGWDAAAIQVRIHGSPNGIERII
jgi:hypothetical protein